MSALVKKAGKTYGKKLFEQHLNHYTPEDPLYEYYTDDTGMQRKKKRDLPPGLSKRDAAILKAVKKRAHYLDKGFSICGFRFGWTFLISLIPLVGDIADAALNYRLVIAKARQADIPPWLLRRMLFNNAVSAGVSLIPILGDIILAIYKANSRNAILLEEFLRIRGEEFIKMGGVPEDHSRSEGWVTALMNKAAKFGVNPKDAEQVKPGAGMTPEEMKTASLSAPTSVPGAVASTSQAHQQPVTAYGTFDNTKRTTAAEAATETSTSTPKSKKRSYSGSSFFFSRKKTPPVTSVSAPGDKGRFIENVQ